MISKSRPNNFQIGWMTSKSDKLTSESRPSNFQITAEQLSSLPNDFPVTAEEFLKGRMTSKSRLKNSQIGQMTSKPDELTSKSCQSNFQIAAEQFSNRANDFQNTAE